MSAKPKLWRLVSNVDRAMGRNTKLGKKICQFLRQKEILSFFFTRQRQRSRSGGGWPGLYILTKKVDLL